MRIQLSHTFKDIISLDNLLTAWQEFTRGKRNKGDVQAFSRHLAERITLLHEGLSSKQYKHGGYYAFAITDPKPRSIHKAQVQDRVLHHAVYRILYPFFDSIFIYDSYSCRKEKGTHKGKTVTTIYTCLNCPYTDKEEFTFSSYKKENPDPHFERDRARFCLSKEQTSHYFEQKISLENVSKMFEKSKERSKHKDVYDAVAQLQTLTIDQVEKTITTAMEKEGYIRLEMGQPDIDKYVIVPFTVRDTKADRNERTSEHALTTLLRTNLEPTSWRLMNEGVSYRMGILSGRLKGYEREEDLVGLVLKQP